MTARKPVEHDERWVAGHDAGYAKGRDDGINIGYNDAKTRTYLALDALGDSGQLPKPEVTKMRDVFSGILGKR